MLPTIDVVGEQEGDIKKIPGAIRVITKEEIEAQLPISTEDVLRMVPGIVIKREEETGVVANIGIRGLSAQDYKLLILEDGVPVAPGAFTGNNRYYNPRIQRMESIEVLKGASSLRFGPNTIGGVINYKTKRPYDGVAITSKIGSFNMREALLEAGGRSEDGNKVYGINLVTASSDGFQNKDYEMTDVMLKAGMALSNNQYLSGKLTYYYNDANISYRGLFIDQYRNKNSDNPAPDDYFLTGRTSFDINHSWDIDSNRKLKTLIYWNQYHRYYWRFGVSSAASLAACDWIFTDTIFGNNRNFTRMGVDSRMKINQSNGNEAEIGVRVAFEDMDKRKIQAPRATPRHGVKTSQEFQEALNTAIFAQNRFKISETLAITPGIRTESYQIDREKSGKSGSDSSTEFIPGIGVTNEISPNMQLYAGAYKAFAPPRISDAISSGGVDQQLDSEHSMNYEIGIRGGDDKSSYELTAFLMDFSNQVIPSNSNPGFSLANAGETQHSGVEASGSMKIGENMSIQGNITFIPEAEFTKGNFVGNRITYTPEVVSNVSLVYKKGKQTSSVILSYVGSQFTDPENTEELTEMTSGFFLGKLDAYTLLDINTSYKVDENLNVFATVKNLTDEHYIGSLRQGIYRGISRNIMIGLKYKFK